VLSQLLLAIPMCLLYEVGIVAARLFGKPARSADEEDKLPEAGEEPRP
jgi:sec-independent protein translocase protein TatC